MATVPKTRRRKQPRPLADELALLTEALRASRNGGFVLMSYDAAEQEQQWLDVLGAELDDVHFHRLSLPKDGVGLAQQIEAAATRTDLAQYDLTVLVVGGIEALDSIAQQQLIINLNQMRTRLAAVAYPLLFCADQDTLSLFVHNAPDLFDRIGIWADLRGHVPPMVPAHLSASQEQRYLDTLIRQLQRVEFRGILSINKPVTLPLIDFYVPHQATQKIESKSHSNLVCLTSWKKSFNAT